MRQTQAAEQPSKSKTSGEVLEKPDTESHATANAIVSADKSESAEESVSFPAVSCSSSSTEILLNPNVFTEFKLAGSQEVNLVFLAMLKSLYFPICCTILVFCFPFLLLIIHFLFIGNRCR